MFVFSTDATPISHGLSGVIERAHRYAQKGQSFMAILMVLTLWGVPMRFYSWRDALMHASTLLSLGLHRQAHRHVIHALVHMGRDGGPYLEARAILLTALNRVTFLPKSQREIEGRTELYQDLENALRVFERKSELFVREHRSYAMAYMAVAMYEQSMLTPYQRLELRYHLDVGANIMDRLFRARVLIQFESDGYKAFVDRMFRLSQTRGED